MSLTVGQTIGGHYNVTRHLGAGGFGETYLAVDMHLPDRPQRVVKRLKTGHSDPSTLQVSRRLFETEAQVLYKLGTHNQIPQLFAHFEEDNNFYLVQEFVDGHDMSQELNTGQKLSESQVIDILQRLLEVLKFVHQNNVIHRDIKPENIIRRKHDDQMVLIDFGIVKEINSQLVVTQGSTKFTVAIGTHGYMPSEQATGEPKFSSDIYAVGILGIQALTGLLPQQLPKDEDLEISWRSHASVSPELANVLSTMVRYDFRMRYPSALEALAALNLTICQSHIDTVITSAAPTKILKNNSSSKGAVPATETPAISWLKSKKNKIWIGVGVGLAVAIASSAIASKLIWQPQSSNSLTTLQTSASSTDQFNTQVLPDVRFTLTKTLVGHSGPVYAVALTSDQRILASGSGDKTIRFWDTNTGKLLRTLTGHSDRVYDLTFRPNGKILVSTGADLTVRVWNVANGNLLKTLKGHSDRIYTVIFSPDGKAIATSSDDRTIKLWNVETGKPIRTLTGHSDRVNDMAFSPDGQTLVSGSGDGTIRLWDVATGQTLNTLSSNSGRILSLVYSPDGKLLATGISDNTIRLWDLTNGKVQEDTLTGHTKDVHTLAFSPDSKLLASGSADHTIRVWNLTLKQSQVLSDHRDGVSSVIFSEDGKLIVSGSLDRTVKIWQREKK